MALKKRGGRWYYRFEADGREYVRSTGLAATERNRTDAERQEWDFKTAILEGRTPPRRIQARLFNDAAEEFLEWAKVTHRDKPSTAKRISTSFASLKTCFEGRMVMSLDVAAVEDFLKWRRAIHGVREVTLRHDYFALSGFFRWAIKKRYARENPVRQTKAPSDLGAIRGHVLTAEEEKKYFKAALKYRNLYDVARLILNLGCRPGELYPLRKADVDLMAGTLRIRDGKSQAAKRTITLTPEAIKILAGRLSGDSEWVFPSKRGRRPILRVNNAHDRVLAETGLRFVLYDLRHTWATRMHALNCPLGTISKMLGHGKDSLRLITRYAHPTQEEMDFYTAKYAASMPKEKPNA